MLTTATVYISHCSFPYALPLSFELVDAFQCCSADWPRLRNMYCKTLWFGWPKNWRLRVHTKIILERSWIHQHLFFSDALFSSIWNSIFVPLTLAILINSWKSWNKGQVNIKGFTVLLKLAYCCWLTFLHVPTWIYYWLWSLVQVNLWHYWPL